MKDSAGVKKSAGGVARRAKSRESILLGYSTKYGFMLEIAPTLLYTYLPLLVADATLTLF